MRSEEIESIPHSFFLLLRAMSALPDAWPRFPSGHGTPNCELTRMTTRIARTGSRRGANLRAEAQRHIRVPGEPGSMRTTQFA
jgi:hypothetical protein